MRRRSEEMPNEPPSPRFERFEIVSVLGTPHNAPELSGGTATVLWRDPQWVTRIPPGMRSPGGWRYLLYFAELSLYQSLFETQLLSEGRFDSEAKHLGVRAEFSLDTILEENEAAKWVEGTYRLPGCFWEVMVFRKSDVAELQFRVSEPPLEWPSGITGVIFDVPRRASLNRTLIKRGLEMAFEQSGWCEVSGPDSMVLR